MRQCWLATAAVFIFLAAPALAIQEPTVTFIPSQISINSSFLMIADPYATSTESVNVKWVVFGIENGYGSFPKVGSKWVCYFSNTDPESTCGPNVFPAPSYGTPYEMQVNATNQFGSTESTMLNVNVGGIRMTNQITVVGSNVYISAWVSGAVVGGVAYKVYNAETIEEVLGKSGTMQYNPNIAGFNTSISLPKGDYYIAFTANTADDFSGGVSKVQVGSGGGTGTSDIKADDIVYSPVIYPGQELSLREVFRITNTGSENLSGISISVPPELSSYISIVPQQTSLGPNESTYMSATIKNILYSTNITTYATLTAGTKELRIPVDLRITVIGQPPESTCSGKADKSLCLGGICCSELCIAGGECCTDSDCSSGQTCSNYKCSATTAGECAGKQDNSVCTGGICCSELCIAGGECCTDYDCSSGQTCSYNYKCEVQANECAGRSDTSSCTGGICCSELCIAGGECCTDSDCSSGKVCSSSSICETPSETPQGGGFDIITIALIGGGVAAAAAVGFFLFKKFRSKGEGEGEEGEEEEFSEEDFY